MSERVRTCDTYVFSCQRSTVFKNISAGACQHVWKRVLSCPRSTVSKISPQEHVRTFENMLNIGFQPPTLYFVQEYHLMRMSACLRTRFQLPTLHCSKNITSGACQHVWEHVLSTAHVPVFQGQKYEGPIFRPLVYIDHPLLALTSIRFCTFLGHFSLNQLLGSISQKIHVIQVASIRFSFSDRLLFWLSYEQRHQLLEFFLQG
jgi:hypothetical protein